MLPSSLSIVWCPFLRLALVLGFRLLFFVFQVFLWAFFPWPIEQVIFNSCLWWPCWLCAPFPADCPRCCRCHWSEPRLGPGLPLGPPWLSSDSQRDVSASRSRFRSHLSFCLYWMILASEARYFPFFPLVYSQLILRWRTRLPPKSFSLLVQPSLILLSLLEQQIGRRCGPQPLVLGPPLACSSRGLEWWPHRVLLKNWLEPHSCQ